MFDNTDNYLDKSSVWCVLLEDNDVTVLELALVLA